MIILILTSCNEPVIETSIPLGDEKYLTMGSDYIFDQNKLPTFELNLPASSLKRIDSDPAAEIYVEGSLTFEDEIISPVRIRYKGSIGAFVGCLTGSNVFQPSGRKICTKLSMKVKINWKGRKERFYGLNKLQFHSQNLDPSLMHERLGYWLFKAMGVPAPRSIHARLIINGTYTGVYALTEQIYGRFVKENFDDGDGNLYKEIWPVKMNQQPYSKSEYLETLKTNEEQNSSSILIKDFGLEIANANTNDLQSVIANRMDIQEILSYIVVDRMIKHDDGPFHWYCFDGTCNNPNYYWYEEPITEKFHLIPWDLDNAFENINNNFSEVTLIADSWGEISNDCRPFSHGALRFIQWSAACDKLTGSWTSYTQEYQALKTQFLNGPFSEDQVNTLLDTWVAQIRSAVIQADEMHDDAISVQEWENDINELKNDLDFARRF